MPTHYGIPEEKEEKRTGYTGTWDESPGILDKVKSIPGTKPYGFLPGIPSGQKITTMIKDQVPGFVKGVGRTAQEYAPGVARALSPIQPGTPQAQAQTQVRGLPEATPPTKRPGLPPPAARYGSKPTIRETMGIDPVLDKPYQEPTPTVPGIPESSPHRGQSVEDMKANVPVYQPKPGLRKRMMDFWNNLDDDRRGALSFGLLATGLRMMASAGQVSRYPTSGMAAIGEGGLAGLGAYTGELKRKTDDWVRQQRQNIAAGRASRAEELHPYQVEQMGLQSKELEANIAAKKNLTREDRTKAIAKRTDLNITKAKLQATGTVDEETLAKYPRLAEFMGPNKEIPPEELDKAIRAIDANVEYLESAYGLPTF